MTRTATPPSVDLPPALPGACFRLPSPAGDLACYSAGPDATSGDATKPPLLLIHSVNAAASAYEVRPVYEHARARRSVYALDLPGYGRSERSARDYSPRLMTDALHAVRAEIARRHGPGPIDGLAVSLGCEFLARAACEAPGDWRRIALVSPTGFNGTRRRDGPPGSTRLMPWLRAVLNGPGWGGALFRGLTKPGVVRYFLQRTWGSKSIDEGMWAYAVRTAREPGAEHAPLAFLSGGLFSNDITRLYESLRLPVWMSHGVRGDFVDYRGKAVIEGRPNWHIDIFPTGALPYFEIGEQFNQRLETFLDDADPPSTHAPSP